jgi:hypothetical protein
MASNRDPSKSYRTNRRGRRVTSSATRSKRTKASTAPKPTSSATRNNPGSGAKSRPVVTQSAGRPSGAQGPRSAPQQGPMRRVTGRFDSATKTKPVPKTATPRVSNVGPQIKQAKAVKAANPGRAARMARKGNKGKGPVTAVVSSLANRVLGPVAKNVGYKAGKKIRKVLGGGSPRLNKDGKPIKVGPKLVGPKKVGPKTVGPKTVGPKKVGTAKVGSIAQAFDKAYGAAKKSGSKTFMFKGKKYTTN